MKIAGIQKTSTVDFPGLLSAVVFVPGCNYNCFYCHNRRLLKDSPLIDSEEILGFLRKRAGMLEGIVVSGGEPTLQPGLEDFLVYARSLSYKIKLDTNGSRPDILDRLLSRGFLDYVAMDYKAPFYSYDDLCGQSGDPVKRSAELLLGSGIDFELRTTLIPHISPEDLADMARALPELPRYILQPYIPQPGDTRHLKTLVPYTPGQIGKMAEDIRHIQPNVAVRT